MTSQQLQHFLFFAIRDVGDTAQAVLLGRYIRPKKEPTEVLPFAGQTRARIFLQLQLNV